MKVWSHLEKIVLALLRIVDRRMVAVVPEMARCYEAVSTFYTTKVQPSWPVWNEVAKIVIGIYGLPLFPGPQATRILRPLLRGWMRNTESVNLC